MFRNYLDPRIHYLSWIVYMPFPLNNVKNKINSLFMHFYKFSEIYWILNLKFVKLLTISRRTENIICFTIKRKMRIRMTKKEMKIRKIESPILDLRKSIDKKGENKR